jgi:hypothetical protein
MEPHPIQIHEANKTTLHDGDNRQKYRVYHNSPIRGLPDAYTLITIGTVCSAIIVLIFTTIRFQPILETIKSILGNFVLLDNKYFLISIEHVIILILGVLLTLLIDRLKRNTRKRKHFPNTYKIVNDKIPESFTKKSCYNNREAENNKIDKIIKSPLEYASQTLGGNLAPTFNPNDSYLDEMYDESIKYIVALTAENPNLWLDPTLCFYMTNCNAVSLYKESKNHEGKNLKILDFENNEKYDKFYRWKTDPIIEKLKKHEKYDRFAFVRFILYSDEDYDCLGNTVFPSLKASQDLFGVKSFFISKKEINTALNGRALLYRGYIDTIWNTIKDLADDAEFRNIIEERSENLIPEFLLLYKENSIKIHTYVNGKAYEREIPQSEDANSAYRAIQGLIAMLSNFYSEQNANTRNWKPSVERANLNTRYSYLCWEDEIKEYNDYLNANYQNRSLP